MAVASRHGWRYLLPPSLFRQCLSESSSGTAAYQRAHHVIERRRIVLQAIPAHGYRKKDEQALPIPEAVDPWALEDDALAEQSNVISRCPGCEGTKKVLCPTCGGIARVRCNNCGGGGKVSGQRGLKNCPSCRGRGDVKCVECRGGKVDCLTCDTAGRVEAWLAIDRQRIDQVPFYPTNAAVLVHKHIAAPTDFDAGQQVWPNQLQHDTGAQPPGAVNLPAELAAQLDRRADRVLATRVQHFTSAVHAFDFETLLGRGRVELAGSPPRVASSSSFRPLQLRLATMAVTLLVGLIVVALAHDAYVIQSGWHRAYGHGAVMAWISCGAALALTVVVAGIVLPKRTWSLRSTWGPAAAAGVLVLGTGIASLVGGPTKAEADQALATGDDRRAAITADALIELGRDPGGGKLILDEVHYREVAEETSLAGKVRVFGQPWNGTAGMGKAREEILALAKAEADRHIATCNADAMDGVARDVGGVDRAYSDRLRAGASLCRVPTCQDCDCTVTYLNVDEAYRGEAWQKVRSVAADGFRKVFDQTMVGSQGASVTSAKVSLLGQALDAAVCLRRLDHPLEEVMLASVKRDHDAATKLLEQERARAAAEAERQRKAEEARKAREAAIEEARQASRRLQCCDGTLSPSCLCSRSNRRGCCSHHGGICGCGD